MNGTKRNIFVLFTFVALFSLLIAACGDDDEDDNGTDDTPAATATTATGADDAETPEGDDAETPEGDDAETPEGEETAATDDGAAGEGDAAAGEELYQAQCMACHTTDGSDTVGPTWQGLWMHDVTLDDGTTVTADEAYITESIQDPGAQVVEGFQPIMPEFDLSDEEITNIIAFIQTLE